MIDPRRFQAQVKALELLMKDRAAPTEETVRHARTLADFMLEGYLNTERVALLAIEEILAEHQSDLADWPTLEKIAKVTHEGLGRDVPNG